MYAEREQEDHPKGLKGGCEQKQHGAAMMLSERALVVYIACISEGRVT